MVPPADATANRAQRPGIYSSYLIAQTHFVDGGLLTRHVINRIGGWIAAAGVLRGWHPSVLSIGNAVAAAIASVPVIAFAHDAHSGWIPGWIALVCWPLAYALDCADGQLARASGKKSEFGARVDVLADYLAQILIVVALATVAAEVGGAPVPILAVMCSLWFFGTFAATLRRSDAVHGHSLTPSKSVAFIMKTIMDTGFVNTLLGAWILVSPTSVIVPAVVLTVLNGTYLVLSLTRETHMSMRPPLP